MNGIHTTPINTSIRRRKKRSHGRVCEQQVLLTAQNLYDAGEPFTIEAIAKVLGGIPTSRVAAHGEAIAALVQRWMNHLIDQDVEGNAARWVWVRKMLLLRNCWSKRMCGRATDEQRNALSTRYIQFGCDILLSEGGSDYGYKLPSKADFERVFGYWPEGTASTDYRIKLHDYFQKRGLTTHTLVAQNTPTHRTFSITDALARMPRELHSLPFTYLDDPLKYSQPAKRTLIRICNIPSKSIRQWAFIQSMIRPQAPEDSNFLTMMSKLTKIVAEAGYDRNADLRYFDFENHLSAYLHGTLHGFQADEVMTRYTNVSLYFTALNYQAEWVRRLSPEQKAILEPFLLPSPRDSHFFKSNVSPQLNIRRDRERVRKDRVAPVADRFYQLRFVVDIRFNELKRLRQGAHEAIEKVEAGEATAPYSYIYNEVTYDINGRKSVVSRHFVLWTRNSVNQERVRREANGIRVRSICHNSDLIQQAAAGRYETYFLQYIKTEDDSGEATDDYWFMDLVRVGALGDRPDKAAATWLAQHGYPLRAFRCCSGALSHRCRGGGAHFARWAQEDLNIHFLPYEELYTGALFGRAIMRLGTTTGARIGEISQIFPGRKCIVSVEMPSGKTATAFTAIPKGLKELRSYYIDDASLRCIVDIVRRHRELEDAGFGGLQTINPPVHLERKCGAAKYVFQLSGMALDVSHMNACLRFVLHGLDFHDSEGNTYSISSHFLRHAFATEMKRQGVDIDVLAELLNQKWVEVTRYYSRPTPMQIRDAAERSFITQFAFNAKHGIREPDEIYQMLKDAEGKVGALTHVLGGTCTEGGFCKAKFQCIGCAANAPDPTQRAVIELKRQHASEWLKTAQEHHMTGEINASRAIINSCDDMLKEMDLLVKASENSEQDIRIAHSHQNGANR